MTEARPRGLEWWHYPKHRLTYRKRTELAIAIVRPWEAAGQFPQAPYAFDHGGLTLELRRLIERSGKHGVSEVEVSRPIPWQGHGRRVDEVAADGRHHHRKASGR